MSERPQQQEDEEGESWTTQYRRDQSVSTPHSLNEPGVPSGRGRDGVSYPSTTNLGAPEDRFTRHEPLPDEGEVVEDPSFRSETHGSPKRRWRLFKGLKTGKERETGSKGAMKHRETSSMNTLKPVFRRPPIGTTSSKSEEEEEPDFTRPPTELDDPPVQSVTARRSIFTPVPSETAQQMSAHFESEVITGRPSEEGSIDKQEVSAIAATSADDPYAMDLEQRLRFAESIISFLEPSMAPKPSPTTRHSNHPEFRIKRKPLPFTSPESSATSHQASEPSATEEAESSFQSPYARRPAAKGKAREKQKAQEQQLESPISPLEESSSSPPWGQSYGRTQRHDDSSVFATTLPFTQGSSGIGWQPDEWPAPQQQSINYEAPPEGETVSNSPSMLGTVRSITVTFATENEGQQPSSLAESSRAAKSSIDDPESGGFKELIGRKIE